MAEPWREYLQHESGPLHVDAPVLCLFLTHNEAPLLPDLFAHYRAMGDMHFVVVNDRSTDTTPDILAQAPDVTVFTPNDGSTYAKDKRAWRGTLLDALGAGRWCLVIDVDERLVWRGYPDRSLADLIDDLEAQGAEALIASMIDMYADKPLAQHIADDSRPLREQFPCFDDPRKDPSGYRSMLMPTKSRKKFPFPNMELIGGMRQRLFGDNMQAPSSASKLFAQPAIGRPRHATGYRLPLEVLRRRLSKTNGRLAALNLTKVPLVKWRKSLRYSGGAHHLNEVLPTIPETGVILHYAVTKGAAGIKYNANRAQHAIGGSYYRLMLDKGMDDILSPTYHGTTRLEEIADLEPFFGGPAP